MDEKEITTSAPDVPYFVYESEMCRQEAICGRLILLAALVFAVFIASNVYWIVRLFG